MQLSVLGFDSADMPERIVTVGDPDRVSVVAEHLSDITELAHKREYRSLRGSYNGVDVGVVSHGVGSAGAGLCFTELCRGGAERIVRAGSAGGIQPEIQMGAVVIASAAVRDDGLSERLVPAGFPAVASVDVINALRAQADQIALPDAGLFEGIILTSDLFYPGEMLGSELGDWAKAHVVAVEMEVATLLVLASLHGIDAGAVLAIDGNPLAADGGSMESYNPNKAAVAAAVAVAVEMALGAAVAD